MRVSLGKPALDLEDYNVEYAKKKNVGDMSAGWTFF